MRKVMGLMLAAALAMTLGAGCAAKKAKSADVTPAAAVGASDYSKVTSYTVEKGDSMWKIASKVYGSGKQFQRIEDANKAVLKGNKLVVGTVLTIPR